MDQQTTTYRTQIKYNPCIIKFSSLVLVSWFFFFVAAALVVDATTRTALRMVRLMALWMALRMVLEMIKKGGIPLNQNTSMTSISHLIRAGNRDLC